MKTYYAYRRSQLSWARPYEPGEDLTGVSVSEQDTPKEGDLIGINPDNPEDRWLISQEYARANLDMVPLGEAGNKKFPK